MSNPLQQTLPANAPSAFSSSNSEGVGGDGKVKSNYKWGMSGAKNRSNETIAPVRNASAKHFDAPADRGAAIGVNSGQAKMPKSRP